MAENDNNLPLQNNNQFDSGEEEVIIEIVIEEPPSRDPLAGINFSELGINKDQFSILTFGNVGGSGSGSGTPRRVGFVSFMTR